MSSNESNVSCIGPVDETGNNPLQFDSSSYTKDRVGSVDETDIPWLKPKLMSSMGMIG